MKSRVSILAPLVAAILFSTGGVGFAIQSTTNDASIAQYGTPAVGSHEQAAGIPRVVRPGATAVVSPEFMQQARQREVGAGTSRLPITGFAAIPVSLGGVALVVGGLFLRRCGHAD